MHRRRPKQPEQTSCFGWDICDILDYTVSRDVFELCRSRKHFGILMPLTDVPPSIFFSVRTGTRIYWLHSEEDHEDSWVPDSRETPPAA